MTFWDITHFYTYYKNPTNRVKAILSYAELNSNTVALTNKNINNIIFSKNN